MLQIMLYYVQAQQKQLIKQLYLWLCFLFVCLFLLCFLLLFFYFYLIPDLAGLNVAVITMSFSVWPGVFGHGSQYGPGCGGWWL